MTDTAPTDRPPADHPAAPAPLLRLGDDWSPAEPGVTRRLVARGTSLMAMQVRFESGAAGARHAHPHEQLTLVLSGRFRFVLGDTPHEISAGQSLAIPGGTEHEALALEAGELLDMFSPVREDLVGP
ncbi:cupin [Deinococcus seoulensis]|uniref:Cupin n=2 Tax=Deinococcus TaxID=1298 RepID=A0ABQ2RWI0_9DEIO|nr:MULTISPECIES: cupin domain-containing protein [Deinococcus]GGR73097.1 cupin [Deinococcus seoulensis]GGS39924.1 cupin [Deinococcus knuensis]